MAYAQKKYVLSFNEEAKSHKVFNQIPLVDSIGFISYINKISTQLKAEGYVQAGVDHYEFINDSIYIKYTLGPLYRIKEIFLDKQSMEVISAAGLSSFKMSNTVPDSVRLHKYMVGALDFLTSNGYPFASVGLKGVTIEDGLITASLDIDKGRYITFGKLNVLGRNLVDINFLKRYLFILEGEPYDHQKLLEVRNRIRDLNFIEEYEPPTVSFVNDQAIINLPLKAKNASLFDFIIGLAPSIENGVRKWNFNGEFNADLVNKIGYGERISMRLKSLTETDRSLIISANYPYILNTSLGIDGTFSIVRNRNKTRDINSQIGLEYLLTGRKTAKVFWNVRSSRLVTVDSNVILSSKKLPQQLDYNFRGGGLQYEWQNLDYRFNPRRGWQLSIVGSVGVRSIVRNNEILRLSRGELDFRTAYDTLNLSALQMNGNVVLSHFIPISTWAAWKTAITSGLRYTNGQSLDNELYRIGGNKLLRGFDELSILTDFYNVFTTEFRIILDQNSFLSFPFIDVSRNHIFIAGVPQWDNAIGVGLGMNFATKAGIFNLAFSAGKQLDNSFDFANTKLHFGYVNLF